MSKSLILLAIVAFGAAAAYQMGARNEFHIKHGHGGGDHGRHGGDHGHGHGGDHHHGPPPGFLRFKSLFFVHSTFCYGLPLPNFTRPDAGNDTVRLGLRKPMVGAPARAFRQILADASNSDSSSDSDSSSSDDVRPKPNETVRAQEAKLSRTVMRAAASVILSQKEGSSDDLCKALVKAEQAWIDFRKANNMSCGGHKKHRGPHGPQGPYGFPRPPMMPTDGPSVQPMPMPPMPMDGPSVQPMPMPPMPMNSPAAFSAAVMPYNTPNGNKAPSKFQMALSAANKPIKSMHKH